MKLVNYSASLLLFVLLGGAKAQTTASAQAEQEGFKDVGVFRKVLFPLCQKSLAARDYGTLISAGHELKKAAWEYSKMKYMTHNAAKDSAYKACRDSLSRLAIAYADAAERYDTNTICALLPKMEEQFEGSAAAIIAYRWAEFDKVDHTVEGLYDALVTVNGQDAQPMDSAAKASKRAKSSKKNPAALDTLATIDSVSTQMAVWLASPVPKEIEYRAKLISEEQTYYSSLVEKMKSAALKHDSQTLRLATTDLKVRLRNFVRTYLQ